MSKPLQMSLHITAHPNGLVLITTLVGYWKGRHVLARTHLTIDPEEGWPTPQRLLLLASQQMADEIAARAR